MSLYVRVFTNFYAHRKTLRLKAVIGNDAFWIPPRLWAYAAENQPDGCFKDFTADEIAMLVGYLGNAQALLEAMLRVGFLDSDPLRIHDWVDHNSYHTAYSERGKKGARARWDKTGSDKTGKDQKGSERKGKEGALLEHPVSNAQAFSEQPSLEEVKFHASTIGLGAWKAEDWFNEMEGCGWIDYNHRPVQNWKAVLSRVRTKWESDGRPTSPPLSKSAPKPPEQNQMQEKIEVRSL